MKIKKKFVKRSNIVVKLSAVIGFELVLNTV